MPCDLPVKSEVKMKKICILIIVITIVLGGCSDTGNTSINRNKRDTAHEEAKQSTSANGSDRENIVRKLKKCVQDSYISQYALGEDGIYVLAINDKRNKQILYKFPTGKAAEDERTYNIVINSKKYYNDKFQKVVRIDIIEESVIVYCNVDNQLHCMILDTDLSVKECFPIKIDVGISEKLTLCVLPKSKKIVYYKDYFSAKSSEGGFYETDYAGKNKKILFRHNCLRTNSYRLNEVSDLMISKDEKKIYFIGSYFKDNSDDSTPCYGVYDLEKSKIKSFEGARLSMIRNQDGCVFTDSSNKTAYDFSGNMVYLTKQDKAENWKFESREEGVVGGVSDYGNLYYSCVADQEKSGVKIYEKKTGRKIFEKKLGNYVENVFLFEKEKNIVLQIYEKDLRIDFLEYQWEE